MLKFNIRQKKMQMKTLEKWCSDEKKNRKKNSICEKYIFLDTYIPLAISQVDCLVIL